MASLDHITQGLYVASTLASLFYTFFSFAAHYAQENASFNTVAKNKTRLAAVVVLLATLGAEAVLLSKSVPRPVPSTERLLSLVYSFVAWALTCLRIRFLVIDLFCLSLLTIVLGASLPALDAVSTGLGCIHILHAARLLVALLLLIDSAFILSRKLAASKGIDSESQPLLADDASRRPQGSAYSDSLTASSPADSKCDTASDAGSDDSEDDDFDSEASRLRKSGSWLEYLRNFRLFLPSMIPHDNIKVQACLVLCIIAVFAGRVLTIAIPQQLGKLVDELVDGKVPIRALLVYYMLTLLDGESGANLVKSLAKIPVQQYSYKKLSNAAFNHVMSLEMNFHDSQDSAEVMKAVEHGQALTNILDTAILEMMPTIIDMGTAFVVLYIKFNSAMAVTMITAAVLFLAMEIVTSSWNIDNRRLVTKAERQQARVMHQSIQGWRTVSAFNMFLHERGRFGEAVTTNNRAKLNWGVRDSYIDAALALILPTTFLCLALILVGEIHAGRAQPGDMAFLVQYWDMLLWPLRFLSQEYRYLMKDLIDAERLLALLRTEPKISDATGARPLSPGAVRGVVEFEHVDFAYDARRPALRDISISAAPGEMVAFVGATGAGKSTVTKLLMRYYDVTAGRITIDGADVRSVTQGSLRDSVGLVPQDPLLFNATIMENLRYARLDATDEEVHDACRAAAVHEHILSFPDGYATKVGESGTRLSGGELQRLAIARVFLRDPPILVFDEATSAVDTVTEAAIQAALGRVSARRTTFVIAHRLSTIVRADKVIVLEAGEIVEMGTHQELLQQRGRYFTLWQSQLGGTSTG